VIFYLIKCNTLSTDTKKNIFGQCISFTLTKPAFSCRISKPIFYNQIVEIIASGLVVLMSFSID
jgi:hypothetical protein